MAYIVAPPCPPIPNLSIPEFLESNPYHNPPDRVVYIEAESGKTITWAQYIQFSKDLASGLRAGTPKLNYGELAVILSPNQVRNLFRMRPSNVKSSLTSRIPASASLSDDIYWLDGRWPGA